MLINDFFCRRRRCRPESTSRSSAQRIPSRAGAASIARGDSRCHRNGRRYASTPSLKRSANASPDGHLDSDDNDDDDNSEEFHYPQSPVSEAPRPTSPTGSSDDSHRVLADLTPQLTRAPDFRVPTHEMPQKVVTPRWTPPSPRQSHVQWERDYAVSQCRNCNRGFNFMVRRVSFLSYSLQLVVDPSCIACKSSTTIPKRDLRNNSIAENAGESSVTDVHYTEQCSTLPTLF